METTQNDSLDNKLSAIDRALAAAAARKAAKAAAHSGESGVLTNNDPASPKVESSKKQSKELKDAANAELTALQKAAAREQRDAERKASAEKRKAEREERRAAKVEANTGKKPAHMKKVERAGEKLPRLNNDATLIFNEVTTNFSAEQVAAIALHLQHFNRVKATERAVGQRAEVGARVRITGGDPRFIGMTGVVSLSRRIRCFVDVPGCNKPVYCFTSDVEVLQAVADEATATG